MSSFNLRIESLVIESLTIGMQLDGMKVPIGFNLRIESLVIESPRFQPSIVSECHYLRFNLRIESLVIERQPLACSAYVSLFQSQN